ncbi:MAG: DEAD/DEAH box helicase family protein [Opitutales bacterium]
MLYPSWRRGGIWARRFCEAFDVDPAYAGSEPLPAPPAIEVLSQVQNLPSMLQFQKDVSEQILQVLVRDEPCRAMASLPTGAGKTRVAMEAIIKFQEQVEGVVLWIGTTEEICEQAIRSYKSVYLARNPHIYDALLSRLNAQRERSVQGLRDALSKIAQDAEL